MPRGKPTSIVEQRITLGTFERQWLVQQEDYLKSQVTQAKTAAVVVPIALGVTTIGAVCGLGYGIYAGMCAMADSIPSNPFGGWTNRQMWHDKEKTEEEKPKLGKDYWISIYGLRF